MKHTLLFFVAMALCGPVATAQEARERENYAGYLGIALGYGNIGMAEVNQALPANYPQLGNHFFCVGFDQTSTFNRFALGIQLLAFVNGASSDSLSLRALAMSNFARFGYVAYRRNGLVAIPMLGVGSSGHNLTFVSRQPRTFQQMANMEGGQANMSRTGLAFCAEVNLHKFLPSRATGSFSRNDFGYGLKIGYQYSLPTDNWYYEEVRYSGGPSVAASGFYVALSVGIGGLGMHSN